MVADAGMRGAARFRLPTGADQEEAADTPDPETGARLLLQQCLMGVTVEGRRFEALSPTMAAQVSAAMAQRDPQAELRLSLTCPDCGHTFSALLDAATYLFQEVVARQDTLYREVHLLALHYHWSEAEILSLTPRKRRRYLDLLTRALSGEDGH